PGLVRRRRLRGFFLTPRPINSLESSFTLPPRLAPRVITTSRAGLLCPLLGTGLIETLEEAAVQWRRDGGVRYQGTPDGGGRPHLLVGNSKRRGLEDPFADA